MGGCRTLAARDPARLARLADKPQAEACSADATDSDSVERCLIAAHEKHGRLEGIVNCVRSLSLKPAHATRDEDWENMLATVH